MLKAIEEVLARLDPLSFFSGQSHLTNAVGVTSDIRPEAPRLNLSDWLATEGEFGGVVWDGIARMGRQMTNQQVPELVEYSPLPG